MNSSRKTIAKTAAVMTLVFGLLAGGLYFVSRSSSPAARLLRQGNQAFADNNFMDALGIYQLAQSRFPQLAEPFYNAANALYRQESYPDAIAQIDQALLHNASDDLAQSSFYNKGNAAYSSQDLATAVQSYIQALLINPQDADAKYNLELALQQQQEQQQNQEQQDQDQQNQDQQNQDQQNQDQQDQPAPDESKDGQNQDGQPQDQPQNGDQPTDQPQDQKQDGQNSDQTDPTDQSGQGDQGEQPPQDNQPQPGQGQPQEGNSPNQPPQNGMVPQPGQRMTSEQARQLLLSIAQGSGTLQERLQQIFTSQRPPSAQDW